MRRLFIVLAKIFGLLQLYWALATFMQVGFAISMMSRSSVMDDGGQYIAGLAGTVIYFVVSVGVALILLIRTDWLADKLKIQADGESGEIKEGTLLRSGVKLIGVYIVAHAIPSFARTVTDYGLLAGGILESHFWTRIIPAVLPLVLGTLLAIRADRVLALITKAEQAEGKRVISAGLVILVLVIMIGLFVASLTKYSQSRVVSRRSTVTIHKDTNTPEAVYLYNCQQQQQTNSQKIFIKAD